MEHDARCRICGGKGEILTERTVGPAGDFRFAEVAPALLGVVFGLVLFAFVGKADARVVDYRPPVKATAPQADGRVHRPPNEDKKPAPDARVVVPRCAPDQRGCK
jgi:hypothetical protein